MLGSHPISAILGARISATSPTEDLRAFVKGLTDVGLYVLLCKPGTKEPLDIRTPKQKQADNEAFAEATGMPGAEHPGGFHLATNDAARLRLYLNRFRKLHGNGGVDDDGGAIPVAPVTFAIDVGRSGVIVVDCDTQAQRDAFCAWMVERSGNPHLMHALPTVLSPGVHNGTDWVHRDGGHYYFAVNGRDLPKSTGKMNVKHNGESFDVFWNNRYVLIPPSERKEGKYERIGPVMSLDENPWLVSAIEEYVERSASRREESDRDSEFPPEVQEGLIAWYSRTPWSELLIPAGWELTGKDTSCGCEVWGRPGGRSNDKSATAHVLGCTRSEFSYSPDPPIHFWSSTPGREIERKLDDVNSRDRTLSKLQLFAALSFDGEDSEAMRAIPELPKLTSHVEFRAEWPFGMSTARLVFDGVDDAGDEDLPAASTAPSTPLYGTVGYTPPTPTYPPTVAPQNTSTVAGTGYTPPPTSELPFGTSALPSENLASTAGFEVSPGTFGSSIQGTETGTNPGTGIGTGFATGFDTARPAVGYGHGYGTPVSPPVAQPTAFPQSVAPQPPQQGYTLPVHERAMIVSDVVSALTPVIEQVVQNALRPKTDGPW